ncbi:MAG: imidazole glycerol phosphate synthase subunit HisF [Longimicrobiales bacterium]
MLRPRVIVCLDVKDGRVVKGTKFRELRDVGDPVELARRYEEEGADEVVFLDISASAEGRGTLLDTVRRTAEVLFVPLTVGGGVRTVDDIGALLRAGADKISVNTAAVERPALLTEGADRFGSQCIVASVDAARMGGPADLARGAVGERSTGNPEAGSGPKGSGDGEAAGTRWRAYTHGGRTPTKLDAVGWATECVDRGAGEILLTSMDQDGVRTGYDLELTRAVADRVTVPVIASGGAGNPAHLRKAFEEGGASAALLAGILHDELTTVGEIKGALQEWGVPVR